MPKPPAGFEDVVDILNAYEAEMKEAINAPHENRRRIESTWDVSSVNFRRTRELGKMLRTGQISKEVFEYCAKMGFVDGGLAKKWKLKGYERLCCVQCVNPKNHDHGGTCVCRVPASKRQAGDIQCATCGCSGCASGEPKPNAPVSAVGEASTVVQQ